MLQRRPGAILQLLLAGGSYKDRKFKTGELDMIGAMPAVAVRHERRRQEKRTKRPSLLYLQSPPSRSPTPSPLQSPPSVTCSQPPPEVYVCGKVSLLHIVVVKLLLGAVLLIVGLVQLNPKADATQHRFLLLGSGAFLTLFGIILGMVRCCVLPWAIRKRHHRHHKEGELENGKPRSSLDTVALNQQDGHNKSSSTVSTTACTAKSNTTPRSSVTSTLPQRPSNATVLSPTEHEALINNANNTEIHAVET
ncbi:uncharacterized protein LOC142330201 [Lycorma delicatula]|uniref:uncharacterized protein LOC142330201 n=1 Tax=Lycorma delicatula TaxID=130591 RepID=UPI003F50E6A2